MKEYGITYRMLTSQRKTLVVKALHISRAIDDAEKTLITQHGLHFDSFEILEAVELKTCALTTAQQQFKLKSYWEQRRALAQMFADDGAHHSNIYEIWKAFGEIMLATEEEKIEEDIASGKAERIE